uniref:Protein tyrosine phosphatase non-receptor type 13 n=1 Tax=Oryzias melastigma TaxID=30732 RepID=A0A3B3D762_ORYME
MHVSLAEALEVRGGPLQEEEVWALLSQSAESLQELFHKDPSAMGFIISPWSLLLMPSGNISFADEYVTQKDLRAFTAPEVLEGNALNSVSDIEKMHIYSLGMTLFWGADYEIPQSQPMKLGEHLNSLLLNMCDEVTVSRMSLRTVLDICSKHIRNSSGDPPFSYIRKLVRLVLGSLSQLDGLVTDRESLPERSKEIRERLRGKGLPAGRSAAPRVLERYKARNQEQTFLNRGLSRSMGSLPIQEMLKGEDGAAPQYSVPDYQTNSESPTELYPKPPSLQQHGDLGLKQARKSWASSVDLAYIDPEALRFGALEDARKGSSALSTRSAGRRTSPLLATRGRDSRLLEFGGLKSQRPHHFSALSVGSGLPGAYDRFKERQRKLQVLHQAVDDPVSTHQRYHNDFSSSSESPSVTSSDPEYRQGRNFNGPEFVKMASEPCVSLTVPGSIMKRGKAEEVQRKVGVVLLNGQKLELTCDIKAVCKDVLDMVVAHTGCVFEALYIAPEGWKEEPKKRRSDVPFNLFFRIKFFLDDVNFILHAMTKHQYYLQLRKDILEERMRCETENAMLLASLALQAEFGDYQPELHGKTYFRLEHYLPVSVLDKVDQTTLREELPILHSNYYGASDSEAEFEFLKVNQRLPEYGVHFHRVLPEKRSQTGILLGVYSKGVQIFEVLNGNRSPVLRFPWRETKKITFIKKKICLQNTSDGIKHFFQTDSTKTCQYLLQLCSDQHKFHLQMKARQNNQELQDLQDLQDLENTPLSSLSDGPAKSLSTRSNPDQLKRISYSELALNKAPLGSVIVHDELHLPGYNPRASTAFSNPRMMSRSHHNLAHLPESIEGNQHNRLALSKSSQGPSLFQQHQRASSDTDSLSQLQDNPARRLKPKRGSDSSSIEDAGQAYVVGKDKKIVTDSLKKKLNDLPSPEREIKTVNLRKDVKYGLGFQVVGGENSGRKDLGTLISSITPGGPADVDGCLKPGDRLISVNGKNLEGLSHTGTVDVLQNTPDDVTLVVSQPVERLYKGKMENLDFFRRDLDFDTSSEEHPGARSPPLLSTAKHASPSSSAHLHASLSSQDSWKNSALKISQPPPNGVQQFLERTSVASAFPAVPQHRGTDPTPPALPPKMRKMKVPEAPKPTENSDWGDSDMDEETYSSSQEKVKVKKECFTENVNGNASGVSSLHPGELYDIELSKIDSSLGISVTVPGEAHGSSMVRVKKLFPGQPAAESGRIRVGDVILRVNQTPLKGLSQHVCYLHFQEVISALRGTGQEVTLLLCRPEHGTVPDMDTSALTPKPSPRKEPAALTDPILARTASPDSVDGKKHGPVEAALDRLLGKTPARHNSYSDSTDGDEEVEEAFSRQIWEKSAYPPSSGDTGLSAFYSPNLSAMRLNNRGKPSLSSPSPDPLPPPLPKPLNASVPDNSQEEVELKVSLVKSEKGSLGFTLTKGSDHGCYIHDIVQDPAKGDGRLKPGDRMIAVNSTDVSDMGHTEVVNLVRAAPPVVELLVGRVLEIPKPPIEAHLLPDICFKSNREPLGLVLDGGSDSMYGVLFVKDIHPGSLASKEGSLRPLDLIHYINGAPTQDLTLSESQRLLELSPKDLTLKATRAGIPVHPQEKSVSFLDDNSKVPSSINGLYSREMKELGALCPVEEDIIKVDLEKPPSGGLGFSVIGGERGIFVKSITPGSVAESSGNLQVGDRLLKVNEVLMAGVSHTKAVTTIRKAKGVVHLFVSRPPDQNPNTYLAYLPINSDTCNGNADYEADPLEQKKEQSAALSEDTDCDGSSLPEDSPVTPRKAGWHEESVDDPRNEKYATYLNKQSFRGKKSEDEITWGSDELPIENLNSQSKDDKPIITQDELTSLPLVRVVPDGQYTGPKLYNVVRMMKGLLEQKVPLQEFENLQNLQPLDDCLIGQTKENKKKNRYKNIVPFDTTRVTLGKDGGYINANFINMPVKEENFLYIACQGPLPNTLGDFWQMVWEQKSNVIAMMTQEVEGGKMKCQRYWPDTPRTPVMVDDRIQITLVRDQHLDNFVIRLIDVKDIQTNEVQHVTHLNYTGWPDHGTPTQPEQLLTFISYMRHVYRSGPIITHCSAGIGRSGTLICLDVVLGLISKDADFDISDIVRNMRLQRHGMVQTEDQYIFCYQVILYVLRCLQAEENISG